MNRTRKAHLHDRTATGLAESRCRERIIRSAEAATGGVAVKRVGQGLLKGGGGAADDFVEGVADACPGGKCDNVFSFTAGMSVLMCDGSYKDIESTREKQVSLRTSFVVNRELATGQIDAALTS